MKFLIQDSFTATPFIGSSGVPLNVNSKEFIKGDYVDATEQMNASRQMIWVSSDGYAIDMTKVSIPVTQVQPQTLPNSSLPVRLLISESYVAPYFTADVSVPSTVLPKTFVKGQYVDASQQFNSLQQPFMVSTDGYVVDMTKVQAPQYQQYQQVYTPPRYYYGRYTPAGVVQNNTNQPAVSVAKDSSSEITADLFSTKSLIKVGVFLIIIFLFIKIFGNK